MHGGSAARKSRYCKIETAPEEVDWTDLAQEPGSKVLEDAIDLHEGAPKPVHRVRIVRRVYRIPFEWDWVGNFIWCTMCFRSNTKLVCQCEEAIVEFSDSHGRQRKGLSGAVGQATDQIMIYEIELELHALIARWDQRRRQAARGYIKRRMPRVVYPWRTRQPILAYDLCP